MVCEQIHPQITLYGAWVTSLGHMEDLLTQLARWKVSHLHLPPKASKGMGGS